ncbi:hypothetical protein [Salipaludibacillus daqingensis]|uniref:hypothetical protein n=1 Tax=Salipaludibacillus daqingensis TaxID=3041001 RepID=UPI0024734215|nr:hypothetical protein [Salipaludibacillus daqingensis]
MSTLIRNLNKYKEVGLNNFLLSIISVLIRHINILLMRISIYSIKNKIMDIFYRYKFKFRADPNKIIEVNPLEISKRINNEKNKKWSFGVIMDGNWDYDVHSIKEDCKFKSIREHFEEGVDWENTELFRIYEERLKKEKIVIGCTTINELVDRYESKIDSMYLHIKANGILLPSKDNPEIDMIYVYIDRDGQFLFSADGNHRLSIAKILGIESIPVKVKARHIKWQQKRENLYNKNYNYLQEVDKKLLNHPDLKDMVKNY